MDKKKTVRKYFSKFLEDGKNGRWQMTNKAEDTIIEGRKLAPQNTKTLRTWRQHRCWKVRDRRTAEHMGKLYKNVFTVGLIPRSLPPPITQLDELLHFPPAIDQRHFPLVNFTREAPESGRVESRDRQQGGGITLSKNLQAECTDLPHPTLFLTLW